MTTSKWIAIGSAAVTAIVASTAVALAGWCWSDPILGITAPGIDEQVLNIIVGVPEENRGDLDGPVDVTVTLPRGAKARIIAMDNIIPERVTIKYSNRYWDDDDDEMRVDVKVHVHGKKPFATAVKMEHTRPDGRRSYYELSGYSNRDMTRTLYLDVENDRRSRWSR